MSTRNISWGVKVAGAKGWQTYHFHVPTVLKSRSLNFLTPSGPVQACNGIAFALFKLEQRTTIYYKHASILNTAIYCKKNTVMWDNDELLLQKSFYETWENDVFSNFI